MSTEKKGGRPGTPIEFIERVLDEWFKHRIDGKTAEKAAELVGVRSETLRFWENRREKRMNKATKLLMGLLFAANLLAADLPQMTHVLPNDLFKKVQTNWEAGVTTYAVFSGPDWCHPCRVLDAKLKTLKIESMKDQVVIVPSPRDQAAGIARQFGFRSFPTVIRYSLDQKAVAVDPQEVIRLSK